MDDVILYKSVSNYFIENKIESLGPHSLYANSLTLWVNLGDNNIATIDDNAFVSPTGEFQKFDFIFLHRNPLKELNQLAFEPMMLVSMKMREFIG